jgi:hypothetical protein
MIKYGKFERGHPITEYNWYLLFVFEHKNLEDSREEDLINQRHLITRHNWDLLFVFVRDNCNKSLQLA